MSCSLNFSQITPFLRRNPAFFRVYLADVLSQLGQGMLIVAFPMFILEATHDVSLAGLAFSGEIASYGLLSPVAGYWADRVEQKTLMLTANLIRIVLLTLLLRLVSGGGGLAGCLALSIGVGAAGALFVPARAAFLRRLLEGDELLAAVALEGTSGFLVRLVAPASMGLLLIWFRPTVGLQLDILVYCLSTFLICPGWVTGPRLPPVEQQSSSWTGGWRHILASPGLRLMLGLDLLLSTVGMAGWSTTVAFLQLVLPHPPACNGWLVASTGLAGACGTRMAGRTRARPATFLTLTGVIAASYLSVPHVHQLAGLVGVWLLRGYCIGMFVVFFSQAIASQTPPERMGRVQAAWEMSACLAAFSGSVATPWLIRHAGPAGSFYLFGSIIGVATLIGLAATLRR